MNREGKYLFRSMDLKALQWLAWTAFGLYENEIEGMERDPLAEYLYSLFPISEAV